MSRWGPIVGSISVFLGMLTLGVWADITHTHVWWMDAFVYLGALQLGVTIGVDTAIKDREYRRRQ